MTKTKEKLLSFLSLKPGWHYGQGQDFTTDQVNEASQVLDVLEQRFKTTDVFPGASGEIQITAYTGNYIWSFEVEDAEWSYSFEHNDGTEIGHGDGLDLAEILALAALRQYLGPWAGNTIKTPLNPTSAQ